MKTKLFFIILFILTSSLNLMQGQDLFIENIYVPNENSQASPHSIIYNDINNLIYVYTGQKIVMIDKSSGDIHGSLIVGETGYFSSCYSSLERTNKLAFDHDNNRLFCANEDDKLLVIDCSDIYNHEIIQEFSSPNPLLSSFIYLNSEIDRIFWVQNNFNLESESFLVGINTNSLETTGIYTILGHHIFDLIFCRQNDYIALSADLNNSASGEISLLDPYTLSHYDSYLLTEYSPNKLIYIEEASRLYCIWTNNNGTNSMLNSFFINPDLNQIRYQPDHSIINFPLFSSESACYLGGTIHYIYFAGKAASGGFKLVIVDYLEPISGEPIVAEFEMNHVDQVIANINSNRIYSSGYTISRIYESEIENTISAEGCSNHLIQVGSNQIAISNIEGNSVDLYTTSLDLESKSYLGDCILKGLHNHTYQKNYWISDFTPFSESYMSIQDLSDNSFNSIPIGRSIYDFTYHKNSENLIISNHDWEESTITVIDGQSDNVLEFPSNQVNVLQAGQNNFTYLGGLNVLESIDMTNFLMNPISNNQMSEYNIIDLELISNGNCLALVTIVNEWGCKLAEIDQSTNSIIGSAHSFDINPMSSNGIYYNKFKNQVYILSEYSVSIINLSTYSVIGTIFTSNVIAECHYSPQSDKIIICDITEFISFYNGSSFDLLQAVILPNMYSHISSFYNASNDRVYLQTFGWDGITYKHKVRLLSYQCSNHQLSSNTYLYQNQVENSSTQSAKMVFDENTNYLYIPNQGLGNISIVECPGDEIVLQPGVWNWISFPRLKRENGDPLARPIMESIRPFPTHLSMINRPLQDANPLTYDITYNYPSWYGDLENVKSTFGYKLETTNNVISYLPMTGTVLDPETEITIFDGHENWVGYFLPETQSPFDAIPEEVLPHLKSIRAQYWSCLNYAFIAPPPKSTASSIGEWKCLCNQGRIEMEYNDMVILTLGNTYEQTFAWNRAGGGGALINKDAPEYFQFSEQPDYEAIFIDLDSIDLPDEIGAFAGDSCIGATKILPDDTAAMICAYTQGFEGEEISFELMYSTKTTRPVVDDYLVFNNNTRINENRKIIIGEKQPFYLVSFNKSNTNTEMINPTSIHCLPNPAGNEAIIAYFIPGESKVQIRLSNSLGKEVIQWNQGKQTPGNYQLKLNTSELPAGYYLVSLYSENKTCTEKLLIVR